MALKHNDLVIILDVITDIVDGRLLVRACIIFSIKKLSSFVPLGGQTLSDSSHQIPELLRIMIEPWITSCDVCPPTTLHVIQTMEWRTGGSVVSDFVSQSKL